MLGKPDPVMDNSRIESASSAVAGFHQRPPDQEVILQHHGKRLISRIGLRINLARLDTCGIGIKPILHRQITKVGPQLLGGPGMGQQILQHHLMPRLLQQRQLLL
jgi:hypothetical protein